MAKKNTVTQEHVDNIFNQCKFEVFHRIFDKQCVVVALLPNGFTIVGEAACVDPANYVEEIGEQIAKERIKNKIWELEGYMLQNRLNG